MESKQTRRTRIQERARLRKGLVLGGRGAQPVTVPATIVPRNDNGDGRWGASVGGWSFAAALMLALAGDRPLPPPHGAGARGPRVRH